MMFLKTALFSTALNFIIIGFASVYYFVIPQLYFSKSETFATLYYRSTSCQIAEQNAVSDFKKGEYLIIWWGLPSDEEFDKIFYSIITSKYKIKSFRGGCVPLIEMDCYNIKMRGLLYKKYGNSFMFNSYKEAKSLYNSPLDY